MLINKTGILHHQGGCKRYCEFSNTSKFGSDCLVFNTIVVKRDIRSLYIPHTVRHKYMRKFFVFIRHYRMLDVEPQNESDTKNFYFVKNLFCTVKQQTVYCRHRIKFIIALINRRYKSNNLNMQ